MITSLELGNFKAFKSLPGLEFGPLTILCGSNSCGKSSILQSLLLLKQTLESQNPNRALLVNGRLVRLGSLSDILYEHDKSADLSLEYVFPVSLNLTEFRGRSVPFGSIVRELFPNMSERRIESPQLRLKIVLSPRAQRSHSNALQPVAVEELTVESGSMAERGNSPSPWASVRLARKGQTSDYDVEWNNLSARYSPRHNILGSGRGQFVDVSFSNIFPSHHGELTVTGAAPSGEQEETVRMTDYGITSFLSAARSYCTSLMPSISYVGPLREEPARRYIYENEVVDVGVKGENAAYIYWAEQGNALGSTYFYDPEAHEFSKSNTERLGSAVQHWLSSMNIHDLKPKGDKNGIISLMLKSGKNSHSNVSIADVGFGVSQVFPIVVAGLRARTGSCLLFEQPEIHLHPQLQMQLADYLLSLALAHKQVVVETHSDHLVNRVVRRIVEDPNGELAKLVRIYFVESGDTGSTIRPVVLDPRSGIVNWPNGFFDQTANEQARIIEAGIRKREYAAGTTKE